MHAPFTHTVPGQHAVDASVHVPHAETPGRSARSTHAPVISPLHKQPVAPTWQRREEMQMRPAPQSADELHPVAGAPGTVHASPVTHVFEQTSPEQHAPLGHARQMFCARHMPQRTCEVSHCSAIAVVAVGHASPSQHA